MKKKLPARFRNILIIGLVILMTSVSILMYRTWKYPGSETEMKSLYSYSHKAAVDYQAAYRANILTGAITVGAGETYITEYLNNLLTTFRYEFIGERPAQYTGKYKVDATLTGWTKEQEKVISIWRKEYQLVPETPFTGTDTSFNLSLDLPLNLRPYADFVKTFIEETKISSEVSLIVHWDVDVEAQTDKGIIQESMAPTMVIPINKNYFTIAGEPIIEKKGAIEESVTRTLPVNKRLLYVYGTGLVLLLAALIFTIFFTAGTRITDPVTLKLKGIFKKYGERLVTLGEEAILPGDRTYPVKTLEDLIKIADELSKPVLYKLTEGQLPRFYVLDEPKIYMFELNPEPHKKTPDNTQITIESTPL